jgi:naphthoate synthase
LLTGAWPYTNGKYAFCLVGDQSISEKVEYMDDIGIPRLNILYLQSLIRSMLKVVIALVARYVISGGQVSHLICALN